MALHNLAASGICSTKAMLLVSELVKRVVVEVRPPGQDGMGNFQDLVLGQDGGRAGGKGGKLLHLTRSEALLLLDDGPVAVVTLLTVNGAIQGGEAYFFNILSASRRSTCLVLSLGSLYLSLFTDSTR